MPDWLHDVRATNAYALFAGAFLGGLFGYLWDRLLSRRESRERRATLLQALYRQLAAIPDTPAGMLPDTFMARSSFHVTVVGQLLDGEVLDAEEDAELIRVLSYWQTIEAQHNEAVVIANQVDITVGLSQELRDTCHRMLDERHNLMLAWRRRLIALLASDTGTIPISAGEQIERPDLLHVQADPRRDADAMASR